MPDKDKYNMLKSYIIGAFNGASCKCIDLEPILKFIKELEKED